MSSTNTKTGRNGKFVIDTDLVARTTQWEVSASLANVSEWGDSDSEGYTNRAAGRKDATFSSEGKYDTTDEAYDLFFIGDTANSVLWMDASTLYWDFPIALCTEFGMMVDIDTEEVIGWSGSFGADGAFTFPGQAGQASRTLPS